MLSRRLDIWLPAYLLEAAQRAKARAARKDKLTHIVFLICDHYEPRFEMTHSGQPAQRVKAWHAGYKSLQARCEQMYGTKPLHSWFYPPHHGYEHLPNLANFVFDGLGEVELHYHHNGDTETKLTRDLEAAIAEYNRWGLLKESGSAPRTSFGFVHGDWALCNSGGGRFCGVNDELTVLKRLGCWADFTLPCGNLSQTRKINSIYYAESSPHVSKSHNTGTNAQVGVPPPAGLMLIQGPLGLNWHGPKGLCFENASLTSSNWGRRDRIDKWLDCNVHVEGRPEWLFVKLHTHGAIDEDVDALYGEKAFEMHRLLNENFNDGREYRLHYVTARQAYNIARAAEDGKDGDPSDWLDYVIPPQAVSLYATNQRHQLDHCTTQKLVLSSIEDSANTCIRTHIGPIRQLVGSMCDVEIDHAAGRVLIGCNRNESTIQLRVKGVGEIDVIEGVLASESMGENDEKSIILHGGERIAFRYYVDPEKAAGLKVQERVGVQ